MISTRINPRILSAVISPALRAELEDRGQLILALRRLRTDEAECLRPGCPQRDLVIDGSRDDLLAASRNAAARGHSELAEAIVEAIDAFERATFAVPLPCGELHLGGRTLLMGVVNVTPDSFSDGGRFIERPKAVEHGLELVEQGADILDIGGESTRPGAEPVPLDEELRRVLPVIESLAEGTDVPISIDTCKAAVAEQAVAAGAAIVNDITGLRSDPDMAAVIARTGAAAVVMHIQGTPRDMQVEPHYDDVMDEICRYLRESLLIAERAGVEMEKVIVDPGIGFGKTVEHNLEVLDRLGELKSLGRPILVGTSRKSTIGKVLDAPVDARIFGASATVAVAIRNGAHVVRVHDVAEMSDVTRMTDAIGRWRPAKLAENRQ